MEIKSLKENNKRKYFTNYSIQNDGLLYKK